MSETFSNPAVDDFRKVMRRLTAAVSLITTAEGDERHGMAVTAVCSLGIAPPSLLISVAHTASMHDPLMRAGRFGVNILSLAQSDLVAPFSGKVKGAARFELGEWVPSSDGLPRLVDAQASVFCTVGKTFEYAGHTVVIGTVTETFCREDIAPLLYENGGFAKSTRLA